MSKKVKTKADILNHPAVDDLHQEDDGCWDAPGWWCYLKPGYISVDMECGTIHERTIADVCNKINGMVLK